MDERELEADLLRPEAHPHRPQAVTSARTHISLLFFTDEHVYKVKRAVDLGFLDFTDLERRRFFCEEEVRLNRRLTDDVHLGVVPIVRDRTGSLVIGGAGDEERAVEWAVKMRRLPANGMLAARLDRGEVDNERIRELAGVLAKFHAGAPTGPGIDEYGAPSAVAALVEENLEHVGRFVGALDDGAALSSERHRFLVDRARRFLIEHRDILARRVAGARIRDGHGDLHAENICCAERGIAIYDCIEFSPRFRCADVACDLAFLIMDLDLRGYSAFGRYLVQEYAALSGDAELVELIDFYKAYRAVVRAKVACLSSVDEALDAEARSAKLREAMAYLDLAVGYELPPVLVLTCGLPATGKSTLARAIARPLSAAVHRSDVRRKRLSGLAPTQRGTDAWRAGIYSPSTSRRTYRDILERSRQELVEGRSVVVDAAFMQREQREPFAHAAEELGVRLCCVSVEADEAVVRERLRVRMRDEREVSDADLEVYLRAREAFEDPTELPIRVRADTGATRIEVLVATVLDRIVAG